MYCLILYKFTKYINGITGLFHIIMYCFNRISCLPRRRRHYFVTNQWEALWAGRHVQPRPRCSPASICRLQPDVLGSRRAVSQSSFIVSPQGGGKRSVFEWVFNRSFNCMFKWLIHSKRYVMQGCWIILTLSATFNGSASTHCWSAKTDLAFLGHDNLFSQIYMTLPEGQKQVIAQDQSISLIRCLFRLVKCKFTEPLYKSAWYTLLSLLKFRTHAQSVKWEGRNLT